MLLFLLDVCILSVSLRCLLLCSLSLKILGVSVFVTIKMLSLLLLLFLMFTSSLLSLIINTKIVYLVELDDILLSLLAVLLLAVVVAELQLIH